mmetsp:Transcript_25719/g.28048  ORF Transcript_25719/g.28048 Transcript_25719/m.28048 type:complete len:431 (+) Transcript_25719:98-1390(+)|eukprot:gene6330-6817_t
MTEFTNRTTFQLSGGRELLNASKVETLLQEWVGVNPTHIKLSNKSFDVEAATKIAEFFQQITSNIEVADISDIIAGRPEEEALKVLRIITNSLQRFELTEVNVSDNAMGAKGVDACKEILKGKKIQKLYVCNDGLSAEASELLADILLSDGVAPLTLFHFYNNMGGNGSGVAISRIITACKALEDLRYSATRCMADGCLAIATAIGSVDGLKRIDLSDNNFGLRACEVLAQGLKNHTRLEHLNLRDAGFGDDGIEAFVNILKDTVFPHLTFLDLSGNEINEENMEVVVEWLGKAVPSLQTLYLDDNEIGSDGAILLTRSIPRLSSLQHLSLTTAEITGKGGFLLAKAVAKVATFQKLDLNGNALAPRAVEEITEVLTKAQKRLGDLEDNDEDGEDDLSEIEEESEEDEDEKEQPDEEADALADALKDAKI